MTPLNSGLLMISSPVSYTIRAFDSRSPRCPTLPRFSTCTTSLGPRTSHQYPIGVEGLNSRANGNPMGSAIAHEYRDWKAGGRPMNIRGAAERSSVHPPDRGQRVPLKAPQERRIYDPGAAMGPECLAHLPTEPATRARSRRSPDQRTVQVSRRRPRRDGAARFFVVLGGSEPAR